MCKLSLPDSIIDDIVLHLNTYSLACTKLEQYELVDGRLKKNPCWIHLSKYWDIFRQDILYFFARYYYMGYCRLPARQDYWVQRKAHSYLPSHWMDGNYSCDKFDYVWRNISLDQSLVDEDFDNNVGVDNDGQFGPEEEVEEELVKTVEEDDDNDNNDDDDDDDYDDDDDDDDQSKEDDEQDPYCDDKPSEPEKNGDNEMSNNNNDDPVDDETINEEDDDDEAEQEKWYYKAKFMLDWVNKFSQTHCVHLGFAINIDEMIKLFKG